MNDVSSIYDHPPPHLADLHTAIKKAYDKNTLTYWESLLVGAAWQTYSRHMDDWYARRPWPTTENGVDDG